jgi:phage head maturation protease
MKRNENAQPVAVTERTFEVCKAMGDLPVKISDPVNPERVIRFKASDDTCDRYDEVILPAGWKFDDFIKNPVMMQFHDYNSWPIGKVVAVGIVGNALMVDAEFDPPEIDESADLIFRKVVHGTVKSGSVGFIPHEYALPGQVKSKALFDQYPKARKIYTSQSLLEWTICPIPANPNALAASMAKRFGTETTPASTVESPDYTEASLKAAGIASRIGLQNNYKR